MIAFSAWVLPIICAPPALAAAREAAPPVSIGEALSAARSELDLQLDLPGEAPPPTRFQLGKPVLWAALLLGGALLAYSLRDVIPLWRPGRRASWDATAAIAEGAAGPPLAAATSAADLLAAEGRFVEAMHVLLLHGLAEMRRRRNQHFAESLTSREILRSARLPERGRVALHDLVGRVEWTYFGEHPAGEADYRACRAAFDALSQALAGADA